MIIVNADDFGKSEEVTLAIDSCMRNGIISSTSLMANMPAFDLAVNLAVKNGYVAFVGLHFNLTSGKPLTRKILNCTRFCNNKGEFIFKRNTLFFYRKYEIAAVREELEAQIKKIKDAGISVSHFDSHHHIHTELNLFWFLTGVLKRNGINKIRISNNIDFEKKGMKGVFKLAYKKIFYMFLHKAGFRTTKKMGDYNASIDKIGVEESDIELMCHPVWVGNKLMDDVDKVPLKEHGLHLHSYLDL